MKFILFLLVVFLVVWLARGGRRRNAVPPPAATPPAAAPTPALPDTMVSCAHCGIHLPQAEALPGRGGVFCGEAHRAAFEHRQGSTP